jgi:hypothetical protein
MTDARPGEILEVILLTRLIVTTNNGENRIALTYMRWVEKHT